jgi:hypothetical protein
MKIQRVRFSGVTCRNWLLAAVDVPRHVADHDALIGRHAVEYAPGVSGSGHHGHDRGSARYQGRPDGRDVNVVYLSRASGLW